MVLEKGHTASMQTHSATDTDSRGALTSPREKSPEPLVEGLSGQDDNCVAFNGITDAEDPRNWDPRYKWLLIFVMSGISLVSNLTVIVCAPAIPAILTEFGQGPGSQDGTLIVSIWNLGATVGCLILAPLSEVYGRQRVYHVSNALFLIFLAVQTQSTSIGMVLAFRCLNGLAIAPVALNAGIVGDLFVVEERGRAQSIMSMMPLLGPIIGPIIGGWLSQAKGWRWSFWFPFFFLAAWSIAFLFLYRETYEPQILRRRASRLRTQSGNDTIHSRFDHVSVRSTVVRAFHRPIRVFAVPVFLLVVIPGCIVEGYTYLLSINIATVYETDYHFSEGAAGLVFIGTGLGLIASAVFCAFFLDWYTKRMKARHNGEIKPEWRLPPMVLGFISSPIGLFIYGWAAEYRVQYVVPIIGTAFCGFATFIILIPMTTYLADTFGQYRASATAAMNMLRNALSTVFPLVGPALYQAAGLGWGNSTLAFIALALLPVPVLLLWVGEKIRKKSKLETWN